MAPPPQSPGGQTANSWSHEDYQVNSTPLPLGVKSALIGTNGQERMAGHLPGRDNQSKDFEAFHRSGHGDTYTPRRREIKLFNSTATPDKDVVVAPWHRAEEGRAWGPKREVGRINKTCVDEHTGDVRGKNVGSPDFPKIMIATSMHQPRSPGYARMLKGKAPQTSRSVPAEKFGASPSSPAGMATTVCAVKAKKEDNGGLGRSKNIQLETGKVMSSQAVSGNYPEFMGVSIKQAPVESLHSPGKDGCHSAGKSNRDQASSVKHTIVHPGTGKTTDPNGVSKNFPFNPRTRDHNDGHGLLHRDDGEHVTDSSTGKPTHAGHKQKVDDELGRPDRGKNTQTYQAETGKVMTKNIPSTMSPEWMKSPFESNRNFFEGPQSHVTVQKLKDVVADPSHGAGVQKHQHQVQASKRMNFPELDHEAYKKSLPSYMRTTEHNKAGSPVPSSLAHGAIPFDFQVGLAHPHQSAKNPSKTSSQQTRSSRAFPQSAR